MIKLRLTKQLYFACILLIISSISFSCKKCVTCTFKYELNGENHEYVYSEKCGDKDERQAIEDECKEAAKQVDEGECECI
ncbi:MAG: hypothetical protein COC01_03765 [Bacteroidetes bacterium]|nr:MAG: hypothetical protein COC01_03765 [Bacteroidota bacterium]